VAVAKNISLQSSENLKKTGLQVQVPVCRKTGRLRMRVREYPHVLCATGAQIPERQDDYGCVFESIHMFFAQQERRSLRHATRTTHCRAGYNIIDHYTHAARVTAQTAEAAHGNGAWRFISAGTTSTANPLPCCRQ
ncbi:unnamed protein product, partial [Urochloa humidicola]